MKVEYKEKIGDRTIIRFIADAAIDSEETKKKIEPMVTQQMTEDEVENLYMENLVYARVGLEADLIDDELAEHLQNKLDKMKTHQLLSDSGEYIADYRGVEYWIKKSGKWRKEKIEKTGVDLPEEAVLQEDIKAEQQEEISAQQEIERIAALTPQEKENEKKTKLHTLAREAIIKAEEAELLDETFDKKLWLQPKKLEIERLYA